MKRVIAAILFCLLIDNVQATEKFTAQWQADTVGSQIGTSVEITPASNASSSRLMQYDSYKKYASKQQKNKSIKPFNGLAISLEFGSTGIGLELSSPISSKFALRAGFTMFPYSYNTSTDIDYDINTLRDLAMNYADELAARGIDLDNLAPEVDLKAKTGLYNGKILVDYHPSRNSSFRLTAGLYFGKDKIVTAKGSLPDATWQTVNQVNALLVDKGHDPLFLGAVIGESTIVPDANGNVDAAIKINTVKPYFGFGFGRAYPKNGWGFTFDLGCMFHGKPKVISRTTNAAELINEELESSGFIKVMDKIIVYPVLSFKVTKKIF